MSLAFVVETLCFFATNKSTSSLKFLASFKRKVHFKNIQPPSTAAASNVFVVNVAVLIEIVVILYYI